MMASTDDPNNSASDNLAVEFYDNPYDDAEDEGVAPASAFLETSLAEDMLRSENNFQEENQNGNGTNSGETTELLKNSYISDMYSDQVETEEYQDVQVSYEDFYGSNDQTSFDENSSFDEKEDGKGSQLMRFSSVVRNLKSCESETIDILYQLIYQRTAWDSQEVLMQRILEFSGFKFSQNSEEYFNRDLLLKTLQDNVLINIGKIFNLDQVQRMHLGMADARSSLIAGIMQFLFKPNHKNRILNSDGSPSQTRRSHSNVPTNCGCRNRCIQKFTVAQRKNLLDYCKELDQKRLLDTYMLNLIEMRQIHKKSQGDEKKRPRDVAYLYLTNFNQKSVAVCKGAFQALHGVKLTRMNVLQKRLKKGYKPTKKLVDFPAIPEPPVVERKKKPVENAEEASPTITDASTTVQKEDLKDENDEDSAVEILPKKKLKEFPLVVNSIENAAEELLLDVHFLLFLTSTDNEKVKERILDFDGFTFGSDTEEYDERVDFLRRMTFKIVSDVAQSFSVDVLGNKEDTIINILKFLSKPNESFIKEKVSMPLSLSDVELDDIDDLSDSDASITCEVVEKKKVECIELCSSGDDSDNEGKPRKEKSPQKKSQSEAVPKPSTETVHATVIPNMTVATVASSTPDENKPKSSTPVIRALKDFETIGKIVNTHPPEYLTDIFDLLYLTTHEPSTLRTDILKFTGFTFERGSQEYIKRKQLLDRMLYNSVRRIYNTLIHTTTEVRVFSKPTMITEIFQFLFKLPDHDTSIRPQNTTKPIQKTVMLQPANKTTLAIVPPPGNNLPNLSGKLSDLKRVFQRVACFPCEYLVDVHKLLFMTDCDQKVIRQNIFAFKGFPFSPDSQDFHQRKMYLEYLTFHSLRKISSVLTTRSVDLRNSTKHELASHLTQVLTEYCNINVDGSDGTSSETAPASNSSEQSSDGVENIVVTPYIDPSITGPMIDAGESSVSSSDNSSFNIAIVDPRSLNTSNITTHSTATAKRKGASISTPPAKHQKADVQEEVIVPTKISVQEDSSVETITPETNTAEIASFRSKLKDTPADNMEEDDGDTPLSSLVGHPIDSVLEKNIADIVGQTDLDKLTINVVIQKVFGIYPKFDLAYRKEFIKATLRKILYTLGQDKESESVKDSKSTDSPDCSVSTTQTCENESTEIDGSS